MNWYKRATRSIRFTSDIQPKINKIIEEIIRFYDTHKEAPSQNMKIGSIVSYNDYYNVSINADIYLTPLYIEDVQEGGKRYRDGHIELNMFYNGFRRSKNIRDPQIKEIYNDILTHELTHASDVKLNWESLISRHNYFEKENEKEGEDRLRPTEFDSYSKNIIESIKIFYNKNEENKHIIKDIIRRKDFAELKERKIIMEHLWDVIILWERYKPKYNTVLLKRIYNEVINENHFG